MRTRMTLTVASLLAAALFGALTAPDGSAASAQKPPAGFPASKDAQRLYDEADLNRAIQAYRFFYPTVSGAAIFRGNTESGLVDNKVFGILEGKPHHVGFTYNSDTPYGPIQLDLRKGPFVIELPPGPLIVMSIDVHQRWVGDMGVPGPDQGKGGKHLILPPGYKGKAPEGYHVWKSTTNRVLVAVRSLPLKGDLKGAVERIQTIKVRPLNPPADWEEPRWLNLTEKPGDTTPLRWENNLKFWEVLQEVIDAEPPFSGYRNQYGDLAALGIVKGTPFTPDARMRKILEQAAKVGLAEMRAQSFADRRPDRVVWKDRKWEWVGLRPENGDFNAGSFVDLEAREVWFYQAIGASPAMFRRKAGSGSLYWLGLRDKKEAYLDGGKTYRLNVPQPVPANLFWSVTVYDAGSRSQIQAAQSKAALRSLFEKFQANDDGSVDLYFGPKTPAGKESQWVETIPGRGWFAYFRIYGPQEPAFNGTWQPGDFEQVK